MNFQPELAAKVIAGEKTVTRRLVSDNPRSPWWREKCSLVVGRDYAVCPGRGKNAIGRVRIVSVAKDRMAFINDAEARREGFSSFPQFEEAWLAINGVMRDDQIVWRVEFEVLPCATCGDSGEVQWNPSPIGDPQCVQSAPCTDCGAVGLCDPRIRPSGLRSSWPSSSSSGSA